MFGRNMFYALLLIPFGLFAQNDSINVRSSVDSVIIVSPNSGFTIQVASQKEKSSRDWIIVFLDRAPSILWVLFAFALLIALRTRLMSLADNLVNRLRNGASIKIGSFELGSVHSAYSNSSDGSKSVISRKDDGLRSQERNEYYESKKGIMLVHQLFRSNEEGQLYDIVIYVVGHKTNLLSVQSVEYFFGTYWNNEIFECRDRSNSFAVKTSAYGSFLCTAEIRYVDGSSELLHRYIDFEMGKFAPIISD